MVAVKGFTEKATPFKRQSHSSLPAAHLVENEVPMLAAREFCRKMFGLFGLPEADILAEEMQPGYRRKCIRLLCRLLGVKRQTVLNWGGSLEFIGMPQSHQRILGLYWERYELLREVKRLRRFA